MAEYSALIVDDEADIRELLEITLGRMGIDTLAVATLDEARSALTQREFDLCLTDMRLPDGDGIDLVRHISAERPALPAAVITAHGNMDTAIAALKAGAFDFVSKPVDLTDLRNLVDQALRLGPPQAGDDARELVGQSAAIERLRRQIAKVARSQAPVVISGESGVGKELVARLIHAQGPRAEQAFVPVNCGAIPRELMESEFFGHRRGSFTGAVGDKDGLFVAATRGTLFLDEIADLPLDMQVKLLRAIQEKRVRPVGATTEIPIDVRIVCASHADLEREVRDGRFRQDLFYRVNVIELDVPALRDRRDDVPLLTDTILKRLAAGYGRRPPELTRAAREALQAYAFPGNVRELENLLERALALAETDRIDAPDLDLEDTPAPGSAESPAEADDPAAEAGPGDPDIDPPGAEPPATLDAQLEARQRDMLTATLERHRWNRTAAARELGLTYRQLRYRLKKLGID